MARILIIDDDRLVSECLSRISDLLGHEVRSAFDGVKGCEVAAEYRPELVFVDLLMPARGGLETIVELKKLLPDPRIIAMSGQPMIGDVSILQLAQKFGAHAVLEKPFNVPAVTDVIAAQAAYAAQRAEGGSPAI